MHYPKEWQEWNMLPDKDYLIELILLYEPGNENASEHDRNGVFHWWLRQEPAEDILLKLTKLTFLDPDPYMPKDVRSYILKSKHCTKKVRNAINNTI